MNQIILVLNTGSSSLKFAIFSIKKNKRIKKIYSGNISSINKHPIFTIKNENNFLVHEENINLNTNSHRQALLIILNWLKPLLQEHQLISIGHRVVHGGNQFTKPTLITDLVLIQLKKLIPLAPLHQPYALDIISVCQKKFPYLKQIAVFDTEFHNSLLLLEKIISLPQDISPIPIRRYGFHGISFAYIVKILSSLLKKKINNKKIIIAHLGAGSSLCAIKNGKSIATTMSFTPLDGLPMSTRCGSIDPGVILYLLAEKICSVKELTKILYLQSGLSALSNTSGDIKTLLTSKRAKDIQAIDYYIYHICREIGALIATLNGLDILIFTGGVGENSYVIREKICKQAAWLNIKLNFKNNKNNELLISKSSSELKVFVIKTDEETLIAENCISTHF